MKVDAPKSQDLAKIMADIQAQNDELAQKNQEELDKYWSQQIEKSTIVVTTQPAEVGAAEMTLTELRHMVVIGDPPGFDEKSEGQLLENSPREVETCYVLQIEQLNRILLHLESGLAQTQAEGQHQTQEYEALLNTEVKLEAESATYHCLLEEGKDFNLGDALDSSNLMQTIQKTTTRWIVDGRVVSETSDTRVLRH